MPDGAVFHPAAHQLQRLINLSNEVERELTRLLGINLTDYRTLVALASSGPVTVGGLAQRIGASPATTAAILDRLEAHGFVRRARTDSDRRRVHVSTTQAVFAHINDLMGPLMRRADDHIRSLPEATQGEVDAFLATINDLLRDHLDLLAERDAS